MVVVAQLVEHWLVEPAICGFDPRRPPTKFPQKTVPLHSGTVFVMRQTLRYFCYHGYTCPVRGRGRLRGNQKAWSIHFIQ